MSFTLDPKRPLYLQIMEEIKKRTVRGQYVPGTQLPSVREMAKEIGVNPNTIARVYMELEREGFIATRRGQGSYVTEEPDRVEYERNRLADNAVEQFIREISHLDLHNGHKHTLLTIIRKEFSEQDKKKENR